MLLADFPLLSLSLMYKISSDKISNDVCLTFDEMYLQKCEEYFAGGLVSCNSNGELYEGLVCLMIGLTGSRRNL